MQWFLQLSLQESFFFLLAGYTLLFRLLFPFRRSFQIIIQVFLTILLYPYLLVCYLWHGAVKYFRFDKIGYAQAHFKICCREQIDGGDFKASPVTKLRKKMKTPGAAEAGI